MYCSWWVQREKKRLRYILTKNTNHEHVRLHVAACNMQSRPTIKYHSFICRRILQLIVTTMQINNTTIDIWWRKYENLFHSEKNMKLYYYSDILFSLLCYLCSFHLILVILKKDLLSKERNLWYFNIWWSIWATLLEIP